MNEPITYSQATGKDIESIVSAMESCLIGRNSSHITMACLAVALIIQEPNLAPQQLADGIRGASEWIAMYVGSLNESETKPN